MADRELYRKIYLRLWRHAAFRLLSDNEKVLALYLVSGPQTNQIGCYYFSPALASEDLNVSAAALRTRIETVCNAFGWQWLERERLFYIPSWLAWNRPNGANATKAWRTEAERVGVPMLKRRLLDAIAMPSERHADDVATQDQDQKQEQKKNRDPAA